tara:strand:+ start:516 stop:710 length:195 start_codon:yes stop_codon:yes gene_type:complete
MYYLGFTYVDAYNLPVYQRKWFINRLTKEIKDSNTSKAQMADQDYNMMQGKNRTQIPSRLRRFT